MMYRSMNTKARWGLLLIFLLAGLAGALLLSGCGAAQAPTPPAQTPTQEKSADYTPPGPTKTGSSGLGSSPVVVDDQSMRYQWVGQIIVSELRGVELTRPCDTWALTFGSPEVESKAVNNAGHKMVVWGVVVRGVTPGGRQTISVEAVYGPDDARPEIAVPDYPCPDAVREQLYSWAGEVVASNLEGRHLELDRGCDSWVLITQSGEVAKKLQAYVGKKLVVWGKVSTEPNIYMRPTISVTAAHGPDEPVIALYVPDYPCPGGTVTPSPSVCMPADVDLVAGEIAAVGKVVSKDGSMYLDTASGRIVLRYEALKATAVPRSSTGETTPGGVAGGAAPSYAASEESLVVGKWLVEGSQLTILVRYIRGWGCYVYPEPVPPPPEPQPLPSPEPVEGMGVLYGQVRIGPLCPVEPCPGPTPSVYSSRSLVLASEAGKRLEVPLTQDGWFKAQAPAGVYMVTLTDCNFLGCKSALPRKVTVVANEVTTLEIDIDTGIR